MEVWLAPPLSGTGLQALDEFEYNLVVLIFDLDNRVAFRMEATLR